MKHIFIITALTVLVFGLISAKSDVQEVRNSNYLQYVAIGWNDI